MDNLLSYARTKLDTFAQSPINDIDSVIFAWLTYTHIECCHKYKDSGVTIRDLYYAEDFEAMTRDVTGGSTTLELIGILAASPRFRDVRISGYTSHLSTQDNIQFSACVFSLAADIHYVAYRGTDRSIVGWKEDFELVLTEATNSQQEAALFLKDAAARYKGTLYIGGHSKGGNLAVYAASHVSKRISDRIETIYSFDGPGFLPNELTEEGFLRIQSKIRKIVPKSSMIGMLFEQECEINVVESNEIALLQHFPVSWQVSGDSFITRDSLTPDAVMINKRIHDWLFNISYEERKLFIDAVFELIESTGAQSFTEFAEEFTENLPSLLKTISESDKNTQKFVLQTMQHLVIGGNSHPMYRRLETNLCDVIKEEQIKLGYAEETIRLYYPLSSLNRLLKTDFDVLQMQEALARFALKTRKRLGDIEITVSETDRFCFRLPPKAAQYVHENTPSEGFLYELIDTVSKHNVTLDELLELFNKYSDKVVVKKIKSNEFDYLIYFRNGSPDRYRYCFKFEGDHLIYHRYTRADFRELGIS